MKPRRQGEGRSLSAAIMGHLMSSKKNAAQPGQLSLDIEPSAEAPASPASASQTSSSAWAPNPDLAWSAPESPWDAILLAAELNHTDLIDSLLALPHQWDLRAQEPGTRAIRGLGKNDEGKTALHLLLRQRSSSGWSSDGFESGSGQAQRQALELVRRGADFLGLSEDRQSALAIAAINGRQDFICGLAGHPDFQYEKIKGLKSGPHNMALTAQDQRMPILGHLIRSGQQQAAQALIEAAGWPVNAKDFLGHLPLGYCEHAHMTEALLKLGADPALEDDHGVNAMTHAQNADNTQERDKMIGLIAGALRKGAAKNDPALLAQLQNDNLPALLEAAQNAPKSSLLKLISAFRFDLPNVRDPKTGATPLMATLLGGRLSSAAHLLNAGCSINAQDANGISAAAYLLLGLAASGSPSGSAKALYANAEPTIDWSIVNRDGLPVAFHPFLITGVEDHSALNTALDRVVGVAESSKAPLAGPGGEPLMSAFAPAVEGLNRDWVIFDMLNKGLNATLKINQPEGVDHLLKVALKKYAPKDFAASAYSYGGNNTRAFFTQIEALIKQGVVQPESLELSTELFDNASESGRSAMAESIPSIHSFLELCSLRQANAPRASSARKAGPRL